LLEADRLDQAVAVDERYHGAKLTAVAFTDNAKLIWDEHEEFRRSLVPAPTSRVSDDLMARAAALWKRCREAEARHGAH